MSSKTKRSCENCKHYYFVEALCMRKTKRVHKPATSICHNWSRRPSRWLSILPTEPGWYWWRSIHWSVFASKERGKELTARSVRPIFVTKSFAESSYMKRTWMYGGQWQGPITPEEGV
jgi:hypothetical protein